MTEHLLSMMLITYFFDEDFSVFGKNLGQLLIFNVLIKKKSKMILPYREKKKLFFCNSNLV